ncbi:SRPBCC family protein [Angustibacter luteus]|uniref:SRPBCC family protein n=1 Tax=Angustibacter luteus TaxID=658456 RepID=A0ABW1JJ43_9ACTN
MTATGRGTASFTVRREVAAPAAAVWALVTDWPSHGRWVAGTRVRTTSARPDGVGAAFVARTGLGPVGFDDPMTVTRWEPPTADAAGRCDVRKTGRVVLGEASFVVTPLGERRCRLDWTEDVEVAGIRRLPLSAWASRQVGAAIFAVVARRLAAEVEAGQPGPASPGRQR